MGALSASSVLCLLFLFRLILRALGPKHDGKSYSWTLRLQGVKLTAGCWQVWEAVQLLSCFHFWFLNFQKEIMFCSMFLPGLHQSCSALFTVNNNPSLSKQSCLFNNPYPRAHFLLIGLFWESCWGAGSSAFGPHQSSAGQSERSCFI